MLPAFRQYTVKLVYLTLVRNAHFRRQTTQISTRKYYVENLQPLKLKTSAGSG